MSKNTMPVYLDHIYIYFECKHFRGESKNRETNQCDDIQFFDVLPENINEADKTALTLIYNQNQNFTTFGYKE